MPVGARECRGESRPIGSTGTARSVAAHLGDVASGFIRAIGASVEPLGSLSRRRCVAGALPPSTSLPLRLCRYDDNGGTVVAVAGDDYCIVAASTRMSTGYSILTRNKSKILRL